MFLKWFPPRKLSVQSRCFIDDSWSAARPPKHSPFPAESLCLFLALPSLQSTQRPSCAIAVLWSFPTATDLVLTGDQFSLLSVTANVSVTLPAKSLAPPKGTRCTQVSPGVTWPGWIPNLRAVKMYRLVHSSWAILAWKAFQTRVSWRQQSGSQSQN